MEDSFGVNAIDEAARFTVPFTGMAEEPVFRVNVLYVAVAGRVNFTRSKAPRRTKLNDRLPVDDDVGPAALKSY